MFVVPREETYTYLGEGHGKTTDDSLVFKNGSKVDGGRIGEDKRRFAEADFRYEAEL